MKTMLLSLSVVIPLAAAAQDAVASSNKDWVYFGTYTGRGSEGIYVAEFDASTGKLGEPKLAARATNPSFLAIHPNRRFLYAVNEVSNSDGKPGGAVSAFAIDLKTGLLTKLNHQSSGGGGPCHLSLDRAGRAVYVANYGGGSVASILVRDDGSLGEMVAVQHTGNGPNKSRQEKPHAHSINVALDDGHAVAADLGIDQVICYRLGADRRLTVHPEAGLNPVPPGSGPRHFAFHPNGKFGYVNNELTLTVTAFSYDSGKLTRLDTISSVPRTYQGPGGSAEIQVHPNGKFLYVSNRGPDNLAVFDIFDNGKLSPVAHAPTGGKTPRHFCIHPAGQFLLAANQDSDNVVLFRIDPSNGMPQPTGDSIKLSRPVCVRFVKRDLR